MTKQQAKRSPWRRLGAITYFYQTPPYPLTPMTPKPGFWQRLGFHDWFLNDPGAEAQQNTAALTPENIYNYILQKFTQSIRELSFADRVVFYHEYIIVLNPEDYAEFMEHKKGLFGVIVQESVNKFHEKLQELKEQGKAVTPSASKWVFRFVSHTGYDRGDLGFIGKLLPGQTQPSDNLRVTFIPRQTGLAETSALSEETLSGFTYYTEGYYELPFQSGSVRRSSRPMHQPRARFEAIIPDKGYAGKKIEFMMENDEVLVTGLVEQRQESHIFKVPSEWVDTPHLRIRYKDDKFYLTSFGEKTLVNEKEIPRSNPQNPEWTEIPLNSRIMLNGIVGINMFKS